MPSFTISTMIWATLLAMSVIAPAVVGHFEGWTFTVMVQVVGTAIGFLMLALLVYIGATE